MFEFLYMGLAIAAATHIIRAVPPGSWLQKRKIKPIACDRCMSFWGTLIAGLVYSYVFPDFFKGVIEFSLLVLLPAFSISLLTLKFTATIEIPQLEEDDGNNNDRRV